MSLFELIGIIQGFTPEQLAEFLEHPVTQEVLGKLSAEEKTV